MYDLFTSALLFFLLTPGVLVTIPPGASPLIAGLVHAVVFYLVQSFLTVYVPNWAIWIVAAIVVLGRAYMGRSSSPTY